MDNVMRDLTRFKAQVMAIAQMHNTVPSIFAVCTLPHPLAQTKYGIDDHHTGLSGSDLQNPEGPFPATTATSSGKSRRKEMKHLNNHKRIHIGQAMVTYFQKLHKIA